MEWGVDWTRRWKRGVTSIARLRGGRRRRGSRECSARAGEFQR